MLQEREFTLNEKIKAYDIDVEQLKEKIAKLQNQEHKLKIRK